MRNIANKRKNEVGLIIAAVVLLVFAVTLWRYFSHKNKTGKDMINQTLGVNDLHNQTPLDNNQRHEVSRSNNQNDGDISAVKKSLQGQVNKIEDGRIVLETSKQEELIVLNEQTKILPVNEKLEVGQSVRIYAYLENSAMVAERVFIIAKPIISKSDFGE